MKKEEFEEVQNKCIEYFISLRSCYEDKCISPVEIITINILYFMSYLRAGSQDEKTIDKLINDISEKSKDFVIECEKNYKKGEKK